MKKCRYCGKEIPEDAVVCAHCGRAIMEPGASTGPSTESETGERCQLTGGNFDQDVARLAHLFMDFQEVVERFMESDHPSIGTQDGVQAIINHELCIRIVSQYLHCRRKYGDQFLEFVYGNMMPIWRQYADRCHEGRVMFFPTMSIQAVFIKLKLIGERCPELDQIDSYISQKMDYALELYEKRAA